MRYILCIFIFINALGFSQINLIPNGKFTQTIYPPNTTIYSSAPWYNPTLASPDFYNLHEPSPPLSYWGIPLNGLGYTYPKIDTNYVGIFVYYPNTNGDTNNIFVEYIATPLSDSLRKNTCYFFTMYYNLGDASTKASNRLGIYFSSNPATSTSTVDCVLPNISPQIYLDTNTFIIDTLNWIKLSGTYIANGGEKFVTIGNFYNKLRTKTISIQNNFPNFFGSAVDSNFCYVYLDDISLYEIPKPNLGNDKTICLQGDSIVIGDNNLFANSFTWYKNDTLLSDTTKTIKIKPSQTSTYVLQNRGCTADTIIIYVKPNCSDTLIKEPYIPNVFSPNNDGINDIFRIELKGGGNVTLSVYNRWGNLVHQSNDKASQTTVLWDGRTTSGEACSEGVYFYTLSYTDVNGEPQSLKGYVSLFR